MESNGEAEHAENGTVDYEEDGDRPTAEQMDIKRHEQMAYEYLSRLNQVASWVSECVGEDLPSGIGLEEVFPNGVFLAKLAHFFSPDTVSLSKIFDIDQKRFMESGLHFRHTDNIMHWIRAMRYLSFPEVFIPDTTDIYDSKNLPKAVFCLIALSLFLYRKGLAPPIRDAHKEIEAAEVSKMAEILRERGIRLPPFSKIEGMLADQLSPDQAELHAAVVFINEAIDSGDSDTVLQALQQPAAHIHLVRPGHKEEYLNCLIKAKTDKCNTSKTNEETEAEGDLYDTLLTRDELQYNVDNANTSEAHLQIVRSLLKGSPEDTVKCLQDPVLKLPRVWLSAAPLYHNELKRVQKESKGHLPIEQLNSEIKDLNVVVEVNEKVDNDQAEDLLSVLRSERLNLHGIINEDDDESIAQRYLTKLKIAKREKSQNVCPMLTKSDIQSTVNDDNAEEIMKGKLKEEDAASKIQSSFKGWKQRKIYKNKIQHYQSLQTQEKVVKAQAQVRMWLRQRKYQERMKYLQQQEESVTKIQRFFRKNQYQKDFQSLTQSDNPSLTVVRKYASLLVETELDYDEDLESHTLKKSMAQIIQSNRKLEEDLSVMDVKIGLLVKNRLGIEEVLKHGQRVSSAHDRRLSGVDDDLSPTDESPKKAAFKAAMRSGSIMDKTNRPKIAVYQHMLYLLQVQPKYMARLLLTVSSGKLSRLIESVCLPLFNYAAQPREEYLLIQLLKQSLLLELDEKVKSIEQFSNTNLTIPKLAVDLCKQIYGEVSLNKTLSPIIQQVLLDQNDHINLNPLEIYKFLVDEPKEGMKNEEAAAHKDVAEVLENSIAYLVKWADVFLMALTESKTAIPYVIRYMGKVVRSHLKSKLMTSSKDCCKAVGYMFFHMYINPAIFAFDSHASVDQAKLTSDDKKKLANIAKLLTYSALNKGYGDEYSYLTPVNQFIKTFHEKLRNYVESLIDVEDPEEVLGVDSYVDYTSTKKPTVIIPATELIFLHEVVESNRELLTNHNTQDDLEDILIDASPIPKIKDLIGETDALKELTLILSAKRSDSKVDDAQTTLFLQTKKMVLDIILCQQGANLSSILETPSNAEQEARHREHQLNNDELRKDRKSVLMSDSLLSLEEKKEKVQENLNELEFVKLVSSEDNYQAIISAIAKDIRRENNYRKTRRSELERLKDTLHRLQDTRNYKLEQMRTWNEYINGCLENLAPKSNKRKSMTGNGETKSKAKKTSIKSTAEKLFKKKIIKSIGETSEKDLKNIQIEILSTDTPGLFEFTVIRSKGVESSTAEIRFQELLQMQYENTEDVVLEQVTFIVDELIFYLNKKFYF